MKLHVITDVHLEFQKWRRVWNLSAIFGGRVVENARGYKDSGLGSVPGFKWNLVIDTAGPTPESAAP